MQFNQTNNNAGDVINERNPDSAIWAGDVLRDLPLEKQCLGKGFVRIVDVMPRLSKTRTADFAIVQAARVSYGQGVKTEVEDKALIRYLLRHRHTTPLEQVEFKLHVKLPIFIARQWIRHRMASVNEVSGRYTKFKDEFYFPDHDEVREQAHNNKQGSEGYAQAKESADFITDLHLVCEDAFAKYQKAIEAGVAKEQARAVLPTSLYTEWYWKIDLHNLLHFLALRADSHAQEEIRVYANAIIDLIRPIVPWTIEAWEDYHPLRGAVLLTRLEIDAMRQYFKAHGGYEDDFPNIESNNKREQQEWRNKTKRLIGG